VWHRNDSYISLEEIYKCTRTGISHVIVAKESAAKPPFGMKLAGMLMRALFLMVLIAITARAASPQVENIWSIFETPGDLIRVAVGLAACAWFTAHIFIPPRDPSAYKTWLYLGPALLPLSLLCAVVVW
jgi:hypothetical protein